jgi:hypothetical protein
VASPVYVPCDFIGYADGLKGMTDDEQKSGFREALETSRAFEFIESLEASEVDVDNFEIKRRGTHITVTCTPYEEDVSEELRAIAAEHGFKRETDAPSLQRFHKETP